MITAIAFLSLTRAGGEIGFDAIIVSVENNMVTAKVTNDGAAIFSTRLPNEIVFVATFSGDVSHADYLSGTIDSN